MEYAKSIERADFVTLPESAIAQVDSRTLINFAVGSCLAHAKMEVKIGMNEVIDSFNDVESVLDQLIEGISHMMSDLRSFFEWRSELHTEAGTKWISEPHTVVPTKVCQVLHKHHEELHKLMETSDWLRRSLCSIPLWQFYEGHRLTKLQFCLLLARGILKISGPTGAKEIYEEWDYHFFEGDEWNGYIFEENKPDPPPVLSEDGSWTIRTRGKIGITPEDVRLSFLRSDQKAYFMKYRPDLFSRFRKD